MAQKQFSGVQVKQSKGDSQTPRKARATGPTWRMPHAVKNLLGSERDPLQRAIYKNMMVEASAYATAQAIELAKKKDKKTAALTDGA
jgi:hypothetical protein